MGKVVYTGKRSDNLIKDSIISSISLDDCELRDCFIEDAVLTNCKLVSCTGNASKYKDVEFTRTSLYQATLEDAKASASCKFGACTIHEATLQNSFYDKCIITSSEVTNGSACDTKFRDATLTNVKFEGKCKFAVCGGDFPKKDDSSDEEMGDMPAPYAPTATATASAPPPQQQQGGYVMPNYSQQPQAADL
eukprot:GDKK01064177.1.p1 GENE.GDKK01064177.1~~GDKK01064177.1.p1  ORF type:complete len:192 (+),score=25.78 GDKK01064177.1:1-576(+)